MWSTFVANINASAMIAAGGVSIIMISNSFFNNSSNKSMFAVPNNSDGLNGTGPDVNRYTFGTSVS